MDADERVLLMRQAFNNGSLAGPLLRRLSELEAMAMAKIDLNIKLDPDLADLFNGLKINPRHLTPETILLAQVIRNQTGPKLAPVAPIAPVDESLTVESNAIPVETPAAGS